MICCMQLSTLQSYVIIIIIMTGLCVIMPDPMNCYNNESYSNIKTLQDIIAPPITHTHTLQQYTESGSLFLDG